MGAMAQVARGGRGWISRRRIISGDLWGGKVYWWGNRGGVGCGFFFVLRLSVECVWSLTKGSRLVGIWIENTDGLVSLDL